MENTRKQLRVEARKISTDVTNSEVFKIKECYFNIIKETTTIIFKPLHISIIVVAWQIYNGNRLNDMQSILRKQR